MRTYHLLSALILVLPGIVWCQVHRANRAAPAQPQAVVQKYIVEGMPVVIATSRAPHRADLSKTAKSIRSVAPEWVIVEATQRWTPGSIVRVAFNGGSDALYAQIEDAAKEWVSVGGANIDLRFRDARGRFYKWSPTDLFFSAEIRIAFQTGKDVGGYWSHVGKDSIQKSFVGSHPTEASMNLQEFDVALPSDWRGIVIHEFGHALGFEHEHQNPVGSCGFRFADDTGYVLSTDPEGYVSPDSNQRRPGLYSYLAGKKNYWDAARVDANLKALPTSSAYAQGPFDKYSVMKYYFNSDMFEGGVTSPCYSARSDNQSLSAGDVAGVRQAYPQSLDETLAIRQRRSTVLAAIQAAPAASPRLKAAAAVQMRELQ